MVLTTAGGGKNILAEKKRGEKGRKGRQLSASVLISDIAGLKYELAAFFA
jgi:hypothetical protein